MESEIHRLILFLPIQADPGFQEVLGEIPIRESIGPFAHLEKIVSIPCIEPQLALQIRLREKRIALKFDAADLQFRPGAHGGRRRSCAPEAQVVAKIETKGPVGLAHGARVEAGRRLEFGDPDLILAVSQIHGIDQLEFWGDIFPYGQAGAGFRFGRDQVRFQPDLANPRACSACRVRVPPTRPTRKDSACSLATFNWAP